MYDMIYDIISHVYVTGDTMQQYVLYCCCALIIILTAVFIDMIYRVFSHFWR